MIKFFIFLMLGCAHGACASTSLYDQLCFETNRLSVAPLSAQHEKQLKDIETSDSRFVDISRTGDQNITLSEALIQQHSFLAQNTHFNKENLATFHNLFCGVFLKDNSELIGCFKLNFCDFIHTDSKIHRNYQGKGFASEFKNALLSHFTIQGWIPSEQFSDTPWHGFAGFIHLSNKPSLAYNLKCGYKIGFFIGDAVGVYFPKVVENTNPLSYQITDIALHDQVIDLFQHYLKPSNPDDGKIADKNLRKISFDGIMNTPEQFQSEAIKEENWFIIRALHDSIVTFSDIPNRLRQSIFTEIRRVAREMELAPIEAINDVFTEHKLKIDHVINMMNDFETTV